jgi:hypothetical protein
MKKTPALLSLLLSFIFITSYTQAQQGERRIAYSHYTDQGTHQVFIPIDSATYIYSGSRSVDSTLGVVQAFDSSFIWNYLTSGTHIFQKRVQTWSNNTLLADTVSYLDTATSTYSYVNCFSYAYYTDGKAAGSITFSWDSTLQQWDSIGRSIFTYDLAGYELQQIQLQRYNAVWDTTNVYSITYNAANQVTSDIDIEYLAGRHGQKQLISYNMLGQQDSIVTYVLMQDSLWQLQNVVVDSYNASGYLSTDFEMTWNNTDSAWGMAYRDSFMYDANHNLTGNIGQVSDSSLGIWMNISRNIKAYDNYNMITIYENDNWDTASRSWQPNQRYHFYYELYTLPSGIATIAPAGDLNIYPVPASTMLSLDIKWNEGQASTATIYDATGRKYGDYPLPNTTSYHGYIPVGSLADGMYTMQIKGEKGSITKSFNIVR